MDLGAIQVSQSSEPTTGDGPACEGGRAGNVHMIWRELLELAHDHLQLAVLETRLAGQSLVAMVVAGLMVAVLIVTAWLGLMAAVVAALVTGGLSVGAAILLGVGANLLLAFLLCAFICGRSRHLLWAASLRSLRSAISPQSNDRES